VICVKLRSPHAGQQMEDFAVCLLMLKLGSCREVEGSSGPVEGKHQSNHNDASQVTKQAKCTRRCIFSTHYGISRSAVLDATYRIPQTAPNTDTFSSSPQRRAESSRHQVQNISTPHHILTRDVAAADTCWTHSHSPRKQCCVGRPREAAPSPPSCLAGHQQKTPGLPL